MKKYGFFILLVTSIFLWQCKKDDDIPELPPEVVNSVVEDAFTVKLIFNKEMESTVASNVQNYALENESINPIKAVSNRKEVMLTFEQKLQSGAYYTLKLKNLKSTTGGQILEGYSIYFSVDFKEEVRLWRKEIEFYVPAVTEEEREDPNNWTLYSLRENKQIPSSEFATDKWDVLFVLDDMDMLIGANDQFCGFNGLGKIGLMMRDIETVTAPGESTFLEKCQSVPVEYGKIPGRDPIVPGWCQKIDEEQEGGPFELVPNRTLLLKLADGKRYAKMQMLGLYKGNPTNPTADQERYHISFRYVIQDDGTPNLNIPIDLD